MRCFKYVGAVGAAVLAFGFSAIAPFSSAYALENAAVTARSSAVAPVAMSSTDDGLFGVDDIEGRGPVAIFFGKMLVGWVINGAIIWATGHSASEWVAIGFSNISSYIMSQYRSGKSKIVIPPSGPYTCPGVVIDHSGICG